MLVEQSGLDSRLWRRNCEGRRSWRSDRARAVGMEPFFVMNGKTLYPSYAGLGRTAMFLGVPLMAALILFALSVFVALAGAAALGPGGLLLAAPAIPVFLFFKEICGTDDQALHLLWLEVQCFLDRTHARCFGNTYTLAPIRYGRRLDSSRKVFETACGDASGNAFVRRFYERDPATVKQHEELDHVYQ
jgi:type IV secretion system protein VirB3